MSVPDKILTWQMVKGPTYDAEARKVTAPGELKKTEIPVPELTAGNVLVTLATFSHQRMLPGVKLLNYIGA
ncbi:MAG: hypothetical protein M1511_03895, partial [Deltaproteobacteria bacterium]|nr:hypothetical protein [Deltaproteobacteria bacterium]